jgi:multidrug transporter EmrE-like cation transporter
MSSYFKVISAKFLDSAILYPISQGSALILSALMAGIFFKEKITFKCIFGMILAFFALLIIHLF